MLPWEGPYLVVKVMSDVTYRIQKSSRSKPQVVHTDRLKPYEGPKLKPWKYEAPVPVERVEGKEDGEELRSREKRAKESVEFQGPDENRGGEEDEDEETRQEKGPVENVQEVREDVRSEPPPAPSQARRNPNRMRRRPSRYDL